MATAAENQTWRGWESSARRSQARREARRPWAFSPRRCRAARRWPWRLPSTGRPASDAGRAAPPSRRHAIARTRSASLQRWQRILHLGERFQQGTDARVSGRGDYLRSIEGGHLTIVQNTDPVPEGERLEHVV